jgi:hypothetical protein
MKLRLVLATIVASLGPAASAQNQPADRMPSYPIEIAPEKVYEYRDLLRVRKVMSARFLLVYTLRHETQRLARGT